MTNQLYCGDNLLVLRDSLADESVDLIYLDPPFNSNASYNVLFKAPSGEKSAAQIEAFDDAWHWSEGAAQAFDEAVTGRNSDAAIMLKAMRAALGENDMMAYLAMMAVRLIESHRALKPTGSLYLHCDPTASHYLKILLDSIFGPKNFRNEISWKRSSAHNDGKQGMKRYGGMRDIILFYTKSDTYVWNTIYTPYAEKHDQSEYRHVMLDGRRYKETDLTAAKPRGDASFIWRVKRPTRGNHRWVADLTDEFKNPKEGWAYRPVPPYDGRYWAYSKASLIEFAEAGHLIHRETGMPRLMQFADEMPGVPLQDVWDDINIAAGDEALGNPTQKPLALLERIVSASSNEGGVVLDPFCGCGAAVHAAQKLQRQWIGVDVAHLAIALIEHRLKAAFPGIAYDVHGVPKDLAGAQDLANSDKRAFQNWIVASIEAQPYRGGKKGMDRGVDGYLHFRDANKKPQTAVISVKGGGIKSGDIRDLKGTMDREGAALGIFLTLNQPTREMIREAATAGFFETGGRKFPRLQILTAEQVIDGQRPQIPFGYTESLKKAGREFPEKQQTLF